MSDDGGTSAVSLLVVSDVRGAGAGPTVPKEDRDCAGLSRMLSVGQPVPGGDTTVVLATLATCSGR